MKKIFFALALATAFVSLTPVQANDVSDANNESQIKYRYENSRGDSTFTEVMVYKHVSPSYRNQPNDCWWDYNEFFNCKLSDQGTK